MALTIWPHFKGECVGHIFHQYFFYFSIYYNNYMGSHFGISAILVDLWPVSKNKFWMFSKHELLQIIRCRCKGYCDTNQCRCKTKWSLLCICVLRMFRWNLRQLRDHRRPWIKCRPKSFLYPCITGAALIVWKYESMIIVALYWAVNSPILRI